MRWNAAIFKLVQTFNHILLPQKFHNDISNGLRVIALTNRQTNPQTDITENNTTSLDYHCGGDNHSKVSTFVPQVYWYDVLGALSRCIGCVNEIAVFTNLHTYHNIVIEWFTMQLQWVQENTASYAFRDKIAKILTDLNQIYMK